MTDLLEDAYQVNDNYYIKNVGKGSYYWLGSSYIDQGFTQTLVIEVKDDDQQIIAHFFGDRAKINAHSFVENLSKTNKWISNLATSAMEQQKEEE